MGELHRVGVLGGLTATPTRRPAGAVRVRACLTLAVVAVAVSCAPSSPTTGRLPEAPHYHALASAGQRLALAAHDGFYLSADAGATWRSVDAPIPHALAVAFDGDDVLVGGQGGVHRRGDDGRWHEVIGDGAVVQALAASSGRVHAWVIGRGLVGLDSGAARPTGPGPDDGLVVLAAARDRMWAAGPNFGVFASADGGRTWTDLEVSVPALAVGATEDGDVFAGAVDGIRRLGPAGWERLDLDPGGPVAAIAASGDALWVLAQGGALYRSDDDGRTWSTVATAE